MAAEISPLAKVGGLGDVIGSLPKALADLGHEVRVIIPKYGSIDIAKHHLVPLGGSFNVLMSKLESFDLKTTTFGNGILVYLIQNDNYFGGDEIYGKDQRGQLQRFLFFSKAVCEVLPKLDWQPEIIHCHDWHTSLVPLWLKKANYPYASLFTIHSLAHFGSFDNNFLATSGLSEDYRHHPAGAPKPLLNFISLGILCADLVTTVSETYAQEILMPEYGGSLVPVLSYRRDQLIGIINGIDYGEYDPATDAYIPANFDFATLGNRLANKLALQKRANLPEDADIPLIGVVSRLAEQKGFDLVEKAIEPVFQGMRAQLVILGVGSEHYHDMLRRMAAKYPEQIAVFITFDNTLAHLIYAGCDMFLMPSRFEPCGLGQLIAMRYGAIPIVRHTGGLVDTVQNLTPDLDKGSGFVFEAYDVEALVAVMKRAISAFGYRQAWREVMRRIMVADFSWQVSAKKYEAAYRRLLELRGHVKK